ncbi:uncharacterized protein MELLADRAFT_114474 [Melampsora larici-populina 98AG31]|uniref:Zn(2)-C6 fungal-type domain-containing protein n=1 Tax=Melampsora larici-populina (strain 98AG31 / pathotype 3-4-7) TaxID=747676 RepID=F4SDL6_MELLP|nr:uncharacterized protein MELLADRAFT_114474 [Melampsora larici-populina 98AG31]EGF97259.1 hypothetical protein MELLADRAFT_114474 [Melampsora larici-populina 98AG31]
MNNQLTKSTLLNQLNLSSTSITLDSIPISIPSTFENLDTCDGPVFANANDERGWVKVNSVSACKVCRARHVRCSLYRTGGPCESCREHNQKCEVLGWELDPKALPKTMYKAVLPPPPPGRVSPICGVSNPRLFSPEELINKLQWLITAPTKITKRKPPMAWPEAQFSEEDPFSNPIQANSGSIRHVKATRRPDSPCTKRMKRSPSFSYQEDERVQTPLNSISTSPFNALDEGSSSPQSDSWSPNPNHQQKMSLSFILCSSPTSFSSEKSSNFSTENDHHDENQDHSFTSSSRSSSSSSTYSTTSSPTLSPRVDRVTWPSFHNLPSLPKIDLERQTGYIKTSNERSERMIEFPEFLPKISEKIDLNHWKCTF